MPVTYTPEDYDDLQQVNSKILVELEALENQGWDKKKDRISKYIDNSRILLVAGKLPLSMKNQFASYIYEKINQYTTISRNGDFYKLFKDDESKQEMNRFVDEKATNISSCQTIDERFMEQILKKPKKETSYTKYLDSENKTLEVAMSLNSALMDKYNESDEFQKILDDNFNEKEMCLDLVNTHAILTVARDEIDERNKLSNSQKCNLQFLINIGETKAEAARKVGYCSKYTSLGIERSNDVSRYWTFLNKCLSCGSDEKAHRDLLIQKYLSCEELGIETPLKGY